MVINEFLPDLDSSQDESKSEWVELANTSETETIDISGFVLEDEKNNRLIVSSEYTDLLEVPPQSFSVIYRNGSTFSLNNSSDIIFLFESTNSATPLDTVAYEKTKEGESLGRFPDLTGDFRDGLTPTPGAPNQPVATPKPTTKPTITPIPIKVSKVEAVTTSTKDEPNYQEQLENESTKISNKKTPETKVETQDLVQDRVIESTQSASRSSILGSIALVASESSRSEPDETIPSDQLKSKPKLYPFFFIASGLSFVIGAVVKFVREHSLFD